MTFNISPLPEGQIRALRASFASLSSGSDETDFITVEEIQSTYDALLASKEMDEESLVALGVAFGEMICAQGDFEWVKLEDEYGSGPALALVGWDVVCSPIDMIEKRLEDGDAVDLVELCSDTIATIDRVVQAGEAGPRKP
ncbi:DUF3806 domain-containing protein [Erythrobacter donghaensis]|uniref:DUF3806 domain-containing protein n=1 Tax=Erythrobacter donghaensis TaxID=267135 RepID=UPI00093DBC86|nr:DUF3806 domain-containing protein [Erythrobacter donghaensis]